MGFNLVLNLLSGRIYNMDISLARIRKVQVSWDVNPHPANVENMVSC